MKKVGWSSILVAVMLLAVVVIAEAQQTKLPKIGWLAVRPASAASVSSPSSGSSTDWVMSKEKT